MKQHPYPSKYRPGTNWATDEGWRILDSLPVGMLPDDYRFLIGGMIAGALMRVAHEGIVDANGEALEILDRLPFGTLPNDYHFSIVGMIAASLIKVGAVPTSGQLQ